MEIEKIVIYKNGVELATLSKSGRLVDKIGKRGEYFAIAIDLAGNSVSSNVIVLK